MPQKIVEIEGLGPVLLTKRRQNRNLRLSVSAKGIVRVSLPYWTPYIVGIQFAKSRANWVRVQLFKHPQTLLRHGDRIGKSHTINFEQTSQPRISVRVKLNIISVKASYPIASPQVQSHIIKASELVLRKEAAQLLPKRLEQLAAQHGFIYSQAKIRKMSSRWGSCTPKGVITLSTYLMQLPWGLIDYVLIHELLHTRHMHHGPKFWDEFESIIPDAKKLRKEVNSHKPRLTPQDKLL